MPSPPADPKAPNRPPTEQSTPRGVCLDRQWLLKFPCAPILYAARGRSRHLALCTHPTHSAEHSTTPRTAYSTLRPHAKQSTARIRTRAGVGCLRVVSGCRQRGCRLQCPTTLTEDYYCRLHAQQHSHEQCKKEKTGIKFPKHPPPRPLGGGKTRPHEGGNFFSGRPDGWPSGSERMYIYHWFHVRYVN